METVGVRVGDEVLEADVDGHADPAMQSSKRWETAVPGAGDADGVLTGAVTIPLKANPPDVAKEEVVHVSVLIFTIVFGDIA